jgi:hypothetical protein
LRPKRSRTSRGITVWLLTETLEKLDGGRVWRLTPAT